MVSKIPCESGAASKDPLIFAAVKQLRPKNILLKRTPNHALLISISEFEIITTGARFQRIGISWPDGKIL